MMLTSYQYITELNKYFHCKIIKKKKKSKYIPIQQQNKIYDIIYHVL